MELTETLHFYRKRQGLSQIELAEALNVSRQTVSKWETGAALPSAENLLALSKLYSVTVDALLNGPAAEAPSPELAPLPADVPSEPCPAPDSTSRRRLLSRLLAVVLLFDLVMFLMDFYLSILSGESGILCPVLRILGCSLIGLAFAWRDRKHTADRRTSLLIGLSALTVGLYAFLLPIPLLWRLYDLIAWVGSNPMAELPSNPLFFFLGWTLADQYAFSSHILLIALFHLGRFSFSRRNFPSPQPVQQA